MPLTIAHILPSLSLAGTQRFVTTLACEQARAGDHPVVLTLTGDPHPTFADELRDAGVPLRSLRKPVGRDPRAALRVTRAVRSYQPDVIHTHGYALAYALPALLLTRAVSCHTLHAVMEVELIRYAGPLYRLAFAAGARPVAISAAVAASCQRRFGLVPPVIDSGVDLERFRAPTDRAATRARLLLPPDAVAVATVANLHHVKGVDLALECVAQVPDAHWVVAGDGPLRPALERRVEALGIGHRVRLLGSVPDVPELLAACDVFLLTSRSEGLGLSAVEALAAGLPCVVPAIGGLPEVVQHDVTGWVTAALDVGQLTEALRAVVGSPELRERLAAAARGSVARFGVERAARAYREVYGR